MKIKQITILFLIYFFLGNFCQAEQGKTIIGELFRTTTSKVSKSIEKNELELNNNMENKLAYLNSTIDKEINDLFGGIERNIDSYLDFHYSVLGEYEELYTAMTGDIEKEIEKKLLGSGFDSKYNSTMKYLNSEYKTTLKQHSDFINKTASAGINMDTNKDIFKPIISEIRNNSDLSNRMGFTVVATTGALAGVKIAAALAKTVTAKAAGKAVIKGGGKLIAKEAAAGTAAAVGLACGPAFWICSPALALGAWFGTDAAVVSIDEAWNRDDFKNKLVSSLNTMRYELGKSLKKDYEENFREASSMIRDTYNNTPVEEYQSREERVNSLFE